jgi:hypothetical protein
LHWHCGCDGEFPAGNGKAHAYATIGIILLAYGLFVLELLSVLAGLVIAHGGKIWYIDRMVLLFEDMKKRKTEYAEWEY